MKIKRFFIFHFSFFISIAALLCAMPQAAAGPPAARAAGIVKGLADAFGEMEGYTVSFAVKAGEHTSQGRYAVEGERYYLTLSDAEVFGDGALRYEIDNRRREVTIDRVDTRSRNILNNPVRAFDFLGSEYRSELLWERDGQAAVRLIPNEQTSSIVHIDVTVSTDTMRPRSLTYNYDGERIEVVIESVGPLAGPLRRFDRKAYAGYELIDFR